MEAKNDLGSEHVLDHSLEPSLVGARDPNLDTVPTENRRPILGQSGDLQSAEGKVSESSTVFG